MVHHSFSVTALPFLKYVFAVSLKYAFIKYAKALISAKICGCYDAAG